VLPLTVVGAYTLPRSLRSVAGAPETARQKKPATPVEMTAWKRKRSNVKIRTLKTAGCGTQRTRVTQERAGRARPLQISCVIAEVWGWLRLAWRQAWRRLPVWLLAWLGWWRLHRLGWRI